MQEVFKVTSPYCGICGAMSVYDREVLQELDLDLVEVETPEDHPRLWQFILANYPGDELVYPSYISLRTRNSVIGGSSRREFRLRALEFLVEKVKIGNDTLPLTKTKLVTHLLPIFHKWGWSLLDLNNLVFTKGRDINPPLEIVYEEGKVYTVTNPKDLSDFLCLKKRKKENQRSS